MAIRCPSGTPSTLSRKILSQSHILIAGSTGSGKSVLLNHILVDAMMMGAGLFYYVDLKKVELFNYVKAPNCVGYADTLESATALARSFEIQMERRLEIMRTNGERMSSKCDCYLVFDEYADVHKSTELVSILESIACKGRCARMHLIICTQRCTRDLLSGVIRSNLTATIGLRTNTNQESRNIIAENYLVDLPLYGQCMCRFPDSKELQRYEIKKYSDWMIDYKINEFVEINRPKSKEERNRTRIW